jgi:hypothetical protein
MCCLEFCLLGIGIVTLFRGKFEWFGANVVTGAAARFIGLLLLLPVALAGTLSFVRGYQLAAAGKPFRLEQNPDLFVLEVLSWVVCLAAAVAVACLSGRRPPEAGPPPFDYKAARARGGIPPDDAVRDSFLPR